MDRRGFLQGLFGVTAAAGAIAVSGHEAAAALLAPTPLPVMAQTAAPAAVLRDGDLGDAEIEDARWVWVRRRRYRRYRIIRRRRVFYRRRRRRYYYPY